MYIAAMGWAFLFSCPGRSPGRAIVLHPGVGVGGGGGVGISKKFNVKVFYVMGKALSGKLSCPYDRSCSTCFFPFFFFFCCKMS